MRGRVTEPRSSARVIKMLLNSESHLLSPHRNCFRHKSYRTTINFRLAVYTYTLAEDCEQEERLYRPPFLLRWLADCLLLTWSLIIIVLKVLSSRMHHFTNSFIKNLFFSPVLRFIFEAEVIPLLNIWILKKLERPSFAPVLMYSCVQRREAQRTLAPGHSRQVRQLSLHSNILRGSLSSWVMWNYVLNSI